MKFLSILFLALIMLSGCASTHEGIDYLGEQPWYAEKKVLDSDTKMWDNGILTIEQRK